MSVNWAPCDNCENPWCLLCLRHAFECSCKAPEGLSASNLGASLLARRACTQAELGAAIGVSAMTISKWERGEKLPSLVRLLEICEALGCTPNDLLFQDDPGG